MWRNKPLKLKKMSIKKLRKEIKKANGIMEVNDALHIFFSQFSPLEIRWFQTKLKYDF